MYFVAVRDVDVIPSNTRIRAELKDYTSYS